MSAPRQPPRDRAIRKRRLAVHRLRSEQPDLSVRDIADRLGVPRSTVQRDLEAGPPEATPAPDCAAGPGNTRAQKHGAYSERAVGPLRDQATAYAQERWPWVSRDDRELYGRLAARVALLGDHELEHGLIKDPVRGEIFATSTAAAKFELQLRALVKRFDETSPPGTSPFGPPSAQERANAEAVARDPVAEHLGRVLVGLDPHELIDDPGAAAAGREYLTRVAAAYETANPQVTGFEQHKKPRGHSYPHPGERERETEMTGEGGDLAAGHQPRALPPGAPAPRSVADLLGHLLPPEPDHDEPKETP